jgi:predicted ATPase/class 3 adenylate cyclase
VEGARSLTFLFTDIEGSTRLWEQDSARMQAALGRHNDLARGAVEAHRGKIVKLTGDGIYAVFGDSRDALDATLALQHALADPGVTQGIALPVRCGLHAGEAAEEDSDFVGQSVNRAARIMSAAHGGQILLSEAVADQLRERLPSEVSLRDLGIAWLRDIPVPQRLYQAEHPGLPNRFPALRSLANTPNNLARQATPFIGRERMLAAVRARMAQARLLTLVGIGGLGKTRLALEVAGSVLGEYDDGAWFVDLAPVSDAALVPQVVAFVLGVTEETGHAVIEALAKFVEDRRLLLILDNCEHLVHACATLSSRLLGAGANVQLLATSREPLHVEGEAVFAVAPLSLPDAAQDLTPAALREYEAIRLFCERATAAQPAFALDDGNAKVVVDICRRLDGLPLALELAAARVRTLPVAAIGERLDDRFRLLTGGDRTRLPRQQTLGALIDWSYDLLRERERALLRRLAVFAGGFMLDAAEAVGSAEAAGADDVLDTLMSLVDKSLVVLEHDHYRLLETVRQYALAKLLQCGDEREARARHLAYYVALAERARGELVGAAQGAWLARFDLERENLLAAAAHCDHAEGGAELGMQLVHAIRLYWLNRGLLELGYRVTVAAVARPGARGRTSTRGKATFVAGQLAFFMGLYDQSRAYLEESAAIAREIGDNDALARALTLLGVACLGHADLATARRHLEESLALAREHGDKVRLAGALNAIAELYRTEGDLDAAERMYEESLAVRRELEDRDAIAIDLLNLAVIAISRGLPDRARSCLREAYAIARELTSRKLEQAVLDGAAGLAVVAGEFEAAARLYGASQGQVEAMRLKREPAVEAFLSPLIAQARSALGASAFGAAEATGRAMAPEAAAAAVGAWLAGA